MNTKARVLAILEENRGTAVSGQTLAQAAGVSRTAVWKAMEQLRQDGHRIQGATNRGYMLAPDSGVLCRETVLPYLTAQVALVTPGAVDSTNNVAKQLAQQGASHGTVVLSHKQTAGRGRMGRRFESPEGGIYVSILLRPQLPPQALLGATGMAAVAVARAVERVSGAQVGIKWTNDLVLGGKKLCGILTEMALEGETGAVQSLVIGAGVNVSHRREDFSPDVAEMAASLAMEGYEVSRPALAAAMIEELSLLAGDLGGDPEPWLADYRRRCVTLGREVRLLWSGGQTRATALDIDDQFGLMVRREDGTEETVRTGEVSVRGLYGYVE